MENNEIDNQDVAEPDLFASGMTGTGQENEELEWGRRHMAPEPFLAVRKTEIIGTGLKPRRTVKSRRTVKPQRDPEEERKNKRACGTAMADAVSILTKRQERIKDYLKRKIDQLDIRVTALEERGNS